MKKYVFAIVLFACNSVFADDFMMGISDEAIANNAKMMMPVYQKLYTCTPASNEYFKIYGQNNGVCRFKNMGYDCKVPMEKAKKYSVSAVKGARDIINGNYSTSLNTPESKYIDIIHKTYCSGGFSIDSIEVLK
ncbi:MAG: hypothetical protein NC408_01160 [Candidatus Gastranaerophilales bacterium]|nr:hypothetical protein [Candidatus Gastranaerophilales bacterium]MCM1072650.1 hypothetical protein [Bacteroides sp.]